MMAWLDHFSNIHHVHTRWGKIILTALVKSSATEVLLGGPGVERDTKSGLRLDHIEPDTSSQGVVAPSSAWPQTTVCPNTPQVCGVNKMMLPLPFESEPPPISNREYNKHEHVRYLRFHAGPAANGSPATVSLELNRLLSQYFYSPP